MIVNEKPKFVYTGEKSNFNVKYFNTNIPNTKPEEKYGAIHFIIKANDERINCYYKNPLDVIEYAKNKIWARGKGSDVEGIARIFWIDSLTGNEYTFAVIHKHTHRYYEPVDRFIRKSDCQWQILNYFWLYP